MTNFDDLARHLRGENESWDTDAAWHRLQSKMHKRPNRRPWLIAAMLIVAVGIGVLSRNIIPLNDAMPPQAAGQRYETATGERRTITLADNSTVDLAPKSVMTVRYQSTGRFVELQGQAFFNVQANRKRPFHVRARETDVVVIGTSFDVRAYADAATRVAVATGRVRVDSVIVTPGEVATAQNGRITVTSVDVDALTLWRTGQLSFSNERFADAAAAIERWYEVDIDIPNPSLANARVTAAFATGQSVDEVLNVLAETLDARMTRAGNRITYQPK